MLIDLTGRTALVTGSTQGIGRAIASTLADAGARVAVNGRTVEIVDAVVSELAAEASGRALVAAPGDVFTRMSRRPNSATTRSTRVPSSATEAAQRSQGRSSTRRPRASISATVSGEVVSEATATSAPAWASATAIARPRPRLAPVTRATWPSSRKLPRMLMRACPCPW